MRRVAAKERARRVALSRSAAASVEAVIALPVLTLLLYGVAFAERAYVARASALVAARRCAYEYAVQGCDAVPAACAAAPVAQQSAEGKASSERVISGARAQHDHDFDVFDDIPVIGNAIGGLFGSTARITQTFALRAPTSDVEQQGRVGFSLACNERSHDVVHEVERVFCRYLPLLPCTRGGR